MKRICLVTDELYPFTAGGIGRLLHGLVADSLARRDDLEFHIVIPSKLSIDGGAIRSHFGERVWAHYFYPIDASRPVVEDGRLFPPRAAFDDTDCHAQSLEIALELRRLEAAGGPFDVIEFPDYRGWAACTLREKRFGRAFVNTEIVIRLHSSLGIIDHFEGWTPSLPQLAWHELERKALLDADRVIAHLPCVAEFNREFYGLPADWMNRVTVEMPPVTPLPPAESPPPSQQHLVFVSKVQRFKRPELFARGAALFMRAHPEFRGNAIFACHLFDLELWTDIRQNIIGDLAPRFVHASLGAERQSLMASGIVVFPSDYESLCLAAIEASMAGGCVVLNECCRAFGEATPWRDGENCYKFDGTEHGLQAALERAVAAPKLRPVEIAPVPPCWERREPTLFSITRTNEPLVSVVVTNRDRALELVDTIASVAASSHPNVEIIVVDDASSSEVDRSYLELLSRERREESGVTLIANSVSCGVSAARNRGIAAARGEWVVTLESGDRVSADYLAEGVEGLGGAGSSYDVAVPQVALLQLGDQLEEGQLSGFQIFLGDVPSLGMVQNRIAPTGAMIRRVLFERFRFDERLPGHYLDWDLHLRLAHDGCRFLVMNGLHVFLRADPARAPIVGRRHFELHGRILEGLRRPLPASARPFAFGSALAEQAGVTVVPPVEPAALRHVVIDRIDETLKRIPFVQPMLRRLTLEMFRRRGPSK